MGGPEYTEESSEENSMGEEIQLTDSSDTHEKPKETQVQLAPINPETRAHRLWENIEKVTLEQLDYARQDVGEGWELVAHEGEMKLYQREKVTNGICEDPIKAVHTVKGVTGFEMCHYFFEPEFRYDWETTLEEMKIVEKISPDAVVFYQIHKRIWPATQRDAVFWSHKRQVTPASRDPNVQNIWIVCNNSTNHDSAKNDKKGKYCRAFLTVGLVCETIIEPSKVGTKLTRDDIKCKITYCSAVNPGGWAPASALRVVYKREYPRFLKTFTKYVTEQCKDKPVRLNE